MKKILSVLLSLVMIISVISVLPFTAQAVTDSVTAFEGTDFVGYLPTQHYYKYSKSQYIIPKEQLTELLGKKISGITWLYLDDGSYYGIAEPGKFEFSAPYKRNVEVYLTEVSNANMTGFVDVSAETAVFSGDWTVEADIDYHDIEVEPVSVTFNEPFTYGGDNIMVTVIDKTGQKYDGSPCDALGVSTGASSWYDTSNTESYSASTTAGGHLSTSAPVTILSYEVNADDYCDFSVTPYDGTLKTANSGGKVYLETVYEGTDGWQNTGYSKTAKKNTSVTIKANPKSGYYFSVWREGSPTGAVFSTQNELTFNATESKTLYAVFTDKASAPISGSCGANVNYTFDPVSGALTITGTGAMDDYSSSTVPWKEYRDSITTVTIGNGVTHIGMSAFENSDGITSVTLGNAVQSIGDYAFNSCHSLASINLPGSLTTLGLQVFASSALTTVSIPSGISAIPTATFNSCKNLDTITIPKSVKSIKGGAFYNCTALTTINYGGSEDDWNAISIGTLNEPLFDAAIYYTAAEPTFKVTYNFNGGTRKGKGNYVTEQVAYAPDITAANFIDALGVTPPEGMVLDAIEINGKRYELGSTYLLNKDTTYKYIWKSTHTHKYTKATTKATLKKNGSIVEKCSCGKVKSTVTIYYPKTVKLSKTSYTYDGKLKKPTVTVTGADGKTIAADNYTVSYAKGRKNAGSYAVTVTFKGNYTGTKKLSFTIKAKDAIGKSTVTGIKNKTYTGKAIKQSITLKSGSTTLKSGTDYTVAYKNNKNVGKATLTITGKGNYSGTKKLTFKINPKGTTVSKVTSPKKSQLKVTIKKQATQTTGYQVQYALKSSFSDAKTVTIGSNKTTTKTISKLKSGKKYYVRVRTYKTVSKVDYYSGWAKYDKAVKVK